MTEANTEGFDSLESVITYMRGPNRLVPLSASQVESLEHFLEKQAWRGADLSRFIAESMDLALNIVQINSDIFEVALSYVSRAAACICSVRILSELRQGMELFESCALDMLCELQRQKHAAAIPLILEELLKVREAIDGFVLPARSQDIHKLVA